MLGRGRLVADAVVSDSQREAAVVDDDFDLRRPRPSVAGDVGQRLA